MTSETPKSSEIKRLTSPLKFEGLKAYDSYGKPIKYSETLSDIRLTVEPKKGILTDDEILQYAPLSKAASQVRLKRSFGDTQDVLYLHESIPWILGLYYVILICVSISIIFAKNALLMAILLILFIIPLIYLYHIFKLDKYVEAQTKGIASTSKTYKKDTNKIEVDEIVGLESLKEYENEISNLNVLFSVKQDVVRNLIKKRFEPPQITHDKFIRIIDNCEKLFNIQSNAALNIINLAAEDTPRVRGEINNKIDAMKRIINQIEDLTNELVINISSDENSKDDVDDLLDDMEILIDSVKEY
ncbi:hypothetical protein [Methanobrevibacter sp. V74]|uniref:hypothetical protein n=1 Tax=Methanobrevibacter sp. V74 TaxID=3064279 RepID=UPI00273326B8|nr:hypothetical protein [Methanobrevibacter sp. V74]